MRRGLVWALAVCLFGKLSSAATVGVYLNQADWEAALNLQEANSLTSISFDPAQWAASLLILPKSTTLVSQSATAAVTIDSTCAAPGICNSFGQVGNGVFNDALSKYSGTTFVFGSGLYGFSGYFNIAAGNGLFISPGGELPYAETSVATPFVSYPGYDGFIGVVTDQPFSDIFISWGDNGSCYQCFGNSYTLSDLTVATIATPEPNFRNVPTALLLLAIGLGAFRRLRAAARC